MALFDRLIIRPMEGCRQGVTVPFSLMLDGLHEFIENLILTSICVNLVVVDIRTCNKQSNDPSMSPAKRHTLLCFQMWEFTFAIACKDLA